MKYIVIFLFWILGLGTLFSQVPVDSINYKEFGLNMTGLVSNFIPFNSTKLGLQRYAFSYKKTRIKKNGKLATFRLGLGFDNVIDANGFFNFNIRIGGEKKRKLSEKFTFISGNDFILFVEPINENAKSLLFFDDTPKIGAGYSHPFGIEYHLNNRVSIYTETALEVTVGFPPVAVRMVPPASIFLNVRI